MGTSVQPQKTLAIIVLAQFSCTSLWFAGNGVMQELISNFSLPEAALGHLTAAVQLGFITGTLLFAILGLADRFSPSRVFFVSALLGAGINLGMLWPGNSLWTLIFFRFGTGFFLAGIYPVGMKIAADYFEKGLGKSLGYLVGALVLGTALPHFIKGLGAQIPWRMVVRTTSGLALAGGLMIVLLIANGPYRRAAQQVRITAFFELFKIKGLRTAAFGYFGHMWELYAFWAFVPLILQSYFMQHPELSISIPIWSFLVIGIGGISCVLGGYLSEVLGPVKVARGALSSSLLCCLAMPVLFLFAPAWAFLSFLLFWGMVVIADSPLFSTLVAQSATADIKGTALTIVNCIGFSITILSIQSLNYLITPGTSPWGYIILALGPLLGLLGFMGRKEVAAAP